MTIKIRNEGLHPSRHSLTRYQTGDMQQAEISEIKQHLDQCKECSQIIAELSSVEQIFHQEINKEDFLAKIKLTADTSPQVKQSSKAPWWLMLLRPQILGAAAAVLLLASVYLLAPFQKDDGVRFKGSSSNISRLLPARRRDSSTSVCSTRRIRTWPSRVLHAGTFRRRDRIPHPRTPRPCVTW